MENSQKSITILENLWTILENLWTIRRQNPISQNRLSTSILILRILRLYILCIRNNKCILLTEGVKIIKKYFILHNMMILHDIIVIFLSLMKFFPTKNKFRRPKTVFSRPKSIYLSTKKGSF
jgi:hypothetical protein